MLGVRIAEGLPLDDLDATARAAVAGLVADGLVDARAALGADGPRRVLLTRRGRLLADVALVPGATHRLAVTVLERSTKVSVDGRTVLVRRSGGGPATSGGRAPPGRTRRRGRGSTRRCCRRRRRSA